MFLLHGWHPTHHSHSFIGAGRNKGTGYMQIAVNIPLAAENAVSARACFPCDNKLIYAAICRLTLNKVMG
eukprot:6203794-Pleurochrysis_carterae.AAC.2